MDDWKEERKAVDKLLNSLGGYLNKVEIIETKCKFCGSNDVVRNGTRKGTQYWLCRNCGRGFVANQAPPRGHFPAGVVANALYNYYAGMSLNAICEGIKQGTGESVSDTSVYNWLVKYTNVALNEAERHKPEVGKKWVMDETVVKLNGKKYWLITAIDEKTRYLLGTKLSARRTSKDIQALLVEATEKTGTIPSVILTDGWAGYPDAIERAYGADSKHISSKPFTDKELSTNLMERWNGTLKDRLKPMRGMDRNANMQLILDGFVFYYNYTRPHMALGGKTPAQVAKTGYPYDSWQDVVDSQMPKLELTDEDKTRYRVDRKRREMRLKRKVRRIGRRRNVQTTMRSIQ